MSIFDDVMFNAKTAASAVGKKAEKIFDLSKLKYAAAGLNNDISKKKEQLGDFVYESSKEGAIDKKALAEKIAEIKELEENLAATKELIMTAKNKQSCKNCGSENEKSALFCNKCGEKLSQYEDADENTEVSETEEAEENVDATVASHDSESYADEEATNVNDTENADISEETEDE